MPLRFAARGPRLLFTGAGDAVPGLTNFWGIRGANSLKTGAFAVKLRRDSDNLTLPFSITASGTVDLAAITTFAGVANLFVDTWYDQIGGVNFVQPVLLAQPRFILNDFNSSTLPSIFINNGSNPSPQLSLATTVPLSATNYTMTSIARHNGGETFFDWQVAVDGWGVFRNLNTTNTFIQMLNLTSPSVTPNVSPLRSIICVNNNSGSSAITAISNSDISGTYAVGTRGAATFTSRTLSIGTDTGNSSAGKISELALWSATAMTPAQVASLYTDQLDYWGPTL